MRVAGRSLQDAAAGDAISVDDARSLIDHLDDALLVLDDRFRIIEVNAAARRMFGITDQGSERSLDAFLPGHCHTGRSEIIGRRRDGSEFPAEVNLSAWSPLGHRIAYLALVHDLTSRRALEQSREELGHLLEGILESTAIDIAVIDDDLRVVAANPPFRQQFVDGCDPVGMNLRDLADLMDDPAMLDVLDVVRQAHTFDSEVRVYIRDHARSVDERWLDVTATPLHIMPGVVLQVTDVSDLVHAARSRRADRVQDTLTGLPSREGMKELLEREFGRSTMPTMCVVMLDIDQFDIIQHTLGYSAGDEIVRQVAHNLEHLVPSEGRLARMMGDTFCVAFHPQSLLDVDHVASELRDMVRQPVSVHGRTVRITASVGSTLTEPDETVERAMQHAELAMQEASRRGGNRCVTYAPELAAPQEGMMRLWNALRSALQFRQMEVWFQPIVSLATDRPIGAEALCRWHHPQFGDISPGEFIPIAERNSEILNIGSFVHGRAAEVMNMLRACRFQPLGNFQISINASPNELAWPQFATNLLARVEANDARPEWFVLDITEEALQQQDDAVHENLRAVAEAGMTLSLDDFGTGYSSLQRLRQMPVNRVKIDRKFVNSMLENEQNELRIAAIIALADELGMQTVAEGVETSDQAARLRALGCRAAQGFLFAPAVPETELLAVLRDLSTPGTRAW